MNNKFNGTAYDFKDGELNETSLSWTSSLDGSLGTGEKVNVTLSIGTHTITLTATDSESNEAIEIKYGSPYIGSNKLKEGF